jgi:hypothetical protein
MGKDCCFVVREESNMREVIERVMGGCARDEDRMK